MTKAERIRVEHARVGLIELAEAEVIHFDGLPGFPEARRFALLRHDEGSSFAWLACLDDPALAFAVVDPLELFSDYAPALGTEQLALVGAKDPAEACLLAIANLSGGSALVNLAAPLLVNATTRRAAQMVLSDERWPVRARLPIAPPSGGSARSASAAPKPVALPASAALARCQTESNPQT
jgi:flagellar assembly factor FliW